MRTQKNLFIPSAKTASAAALALSVAPGCAATLPAPATSHVTSTTQARGSEAKASALPRSVDAKSAAAAAMDGARSRGRAAVWSSSFEPEYPRKAIETGTYTKLREAYEEGLREAGITPGAAGDATDRFGSCYTPARFNKLQMVCPTVGVDTFSR